MSISKTTYSRRRDIDVTRELIVGSLFFFHTASIFGELDFYVKNEPPEPAATFVIIFTSLWGMPLLFTIAGFAIWHSLQKRTVAAFVRERLHRLFIPFIVGLLVIVPPQIYFHLRGDPAYQDSYAQFYPRFFDVAFAIDFPSLIQADPTTNLFQAAHLWFLYILFVFTLLLLPVFLFLGRTAGRQLVGHVAGFLARPWAIFLLALPIAVIEAALGTDLQGGWNQSAYLVFLIYGYLLAADARFGQILSASRIRSLVLAVLGTAAGMVGLAMVAKSTDSDPLQSYDLASVMLRFFKGVVGWCWLAAILGFLEDARNKWQRARDARHSRDGSLMSPRSRTFLVSVERYANEAVLPFYLLHQTIIVAIGFYVVPWRISALLKFLIISSTAFVITLLLYEAVIRRTRLTQFLFGMKTDTVPGS